MANRIPHSSSVSPPLPASQPSVILCRFMTEPPIPSFKAIITIQSDWSIQDVILKIHQTILDETSSTEYQAFFHGPEPQHRLTLEKSDGFRLPLAESCQVIHQDDIIHVRICSMITLRSSTPPPLPPTTSQVSSDAASEKNPADNLRPIVPKNENQVPQPLCEIPRSRSHIFAFRQWAPRHYPQLSSFSNLPIHTDTGTSNLSLMPMPSSSKRHDPQKTNATDPAQSNSKTTNLKFKCVKIPQAAIGRPRQYKTRHSLGTTTTSFPTLVLRPRPFTSTTRTSARANRGGQVCPLGRFFFARNQLSLIMSSFSSNSFGTGKSS